MQILQLGKIPYLEAEAYMLNCLEQRIAGKMVDTLLLCEHDPVYTLGRRQDAQQNVLNPKEIPVVQARRGGDVTYHGPGQLVGYPILELKEHRKDLHAYLRFLEQVWIDYFDTISISANRDDRNTGVWVNNKKMVAVGIACRRWVTWHGFACNIDLDLDPFSNINPCGMKSSLVTRLSDHWKDPISIGTLAEEFSLYFKDAWIKWNLKTS